MSEILSVNDLEVRYSTGAYGLSPLSLQVDEGEFLAIIGPSGAGKTTFLRSLNRLVEPTGGMVRLAGRTAQDLSIGELRRSVAMVFQQPNVVPRMTAMENVLNGRLGHLTGWRRAVPVFDRRDKEVALSALARVGLLHYAMTPCSRLSGGELQRVAIARALAQEARLILADEPVASLDPENALRVMTLLKDINQNEKVTVLVNLHQIDLVKMFSDSVAAFRKGCLLFRGRTADLSDEHYKAVFASA